ncbi:MAG: class I SAM-dependent methyltransferase [Chlorobiaceae bacterium]|nr:class I SAM-dependent methyltransferase [Chlorobiaceae bacterium]
MLQLKTAGFKALDNLRMEGIFPPCWKNMAALETAANDSISQFLAERFRISQELGGAFLWPELIDRTLRTSETEYMDTESIPEWEKLELVKALDRQNTMMQLYPRYVELLIPLINEIAEHKKHDVRVLELACGAGGLTLALAEALRTKNLPASVTGSDIVPSYIEAGNALAAKKKLPASFRQLNAFELNSAGKGVFDLVVISQSLHHFTPGQLAIMIALASEHAASAFVGIDGYRSLLLACGVPLVAAMQGIMSFTLDGVTSARKFYTELELDMIAEIATGKRTHTVSCSWPLSILTVRF